MKHTKAYNKWVDRLWTNILTKAEVQQFAQAVTRRALGAEPHGRRTNLTDEEAKVLYDRLLCDPVRLTETHTQQGLTWLRDRGAKALDIPADDLAEILANFSHFTWNGAVEFTGPYSNGTLPVWTVHLTDGRVLQYYNGAWQSEPGNTSWWWVREHVATEF